MIVVVGDIAVDIISVLREPLARGSDAAADIRIMPGGSGANAAVWLARIGQPVTFVGRVGADYFGEWLAADLVAEGVRPQLAIDGSLRTSVIQVLVEPGGERTMIPDRGANAVWSVDDIPEAIIAQARMVHVVGYVLLDPQSQAGARQAMAYPRAHGVPISLDPSSHAPIQRLGSDSFWSLAGHVEVLLPNRFEASALTGEPDAGAALRRLRRHADVVAIKLDRDGCIAGDATAEWSIAAPKAEISNATGAGDAFDAAFIARWQDGGDIEAACRAAVALGAHAASLPSTR